MTRPSCSRSASGPRNWWDGRACDGDSHGAVFGPHVRQGWSRRQNRDERHLAGLVYLRITYNTFSGGATNDHPTSKIRDVFRPLLPRDRSLVLSCAPVYANRPAINNFHAPGNNATRCHGRRRWEPLSYGWGGTDSMAAGEICWLRLWWSPQYCATCSKSLLQCTFALFFDTILQWPFISHDHMRHIPRAQREDAPTHVTLFLFPINLPTHRHRHGSTLYITGSSHVAAKAMVCTTLSAAAAALGVTSASLVLYQHVGPPELINGVSRRMLVGNGQPRKTSYFSFRASVFSRQLIWFV